MNDDQFTKLFTYMTERFDGIDAQLENIATKDDIRRLESLIDGYAAKLDTYAAEMAAMQHKIDRLERYITFLADKVGVDRKVLEAL
jgi:hypothetical protein